MSWQRIVRNETRQQRRRPQNILLFSKFKDQIKKQINNNKNNSNNKIIINQRRKKQSTIQGSSAISKQKKDKNKNFGILLHPFAYQQDTLFSSISIAGGNLRNSRNSSFDMFLVATFICILLSKNFILFSFMRPNWFVSHTRTHSRLGILNWVFVFSFVFCEFEIFSSCVFLLTYVFRFVCIWMSCA